MIYYCIANGEFPDDLKHADVIPVYKKNEKCNKTNYRSVSILANISKIYEKLLYDQLSKYFDSLRATNQCGFRKGFSSQYCLLVMLEKCKEAIDRGNQFGALLTDLSKAFDCIDNKFLIVMLSEYGVSSSALNVISSYLKHRTLRTKTNDCFSTRSNIEYGVPQGSILGPLRFNINMIDLCYECKQNDIANYADDTTPYFCGTDIPTVIFELQDISTKVFNWFGNNHMKANPGKCHLLLSTKSPEVVSINGIQITSSAAEILVGITNSSRYLLMEDNSFSIHERNIQSLAIEIYKFLNGLSPSFLNNVFHKNISNSYDLRNHKELYSRNPKTVRCGTETVSHIAPNLEQSYINY